MMTFKRATGIIKGRVQAVGYRSFVEDEADRLGLTGWVRNLYSGEVEFVAEGEEADLRKFCASVVKGPPLAFVSEYNVDWSPGTGEFRSFNIRATFISD
jgi:acylphosphatase